MNRLLIILLIGVLAVTGSQAQVLCNGAKALRSVPNAASTSGKVVRQLQQQSWRAEQAARAATMGRMKVKPTGVPMVIPNLDSDDQKRKNGDKVRIRPLPKFKPLPKIKTFSEMEEERLAAEYDSIKVLVNSGLYVPARFSYFQLADYAMRHNDAPFAITCIELVKPDRLSPKYLEYIARRYKALNSYMPEISRSVAINAYGKMVQAKYNGADCDSARMQGGDTLLIVTDQYNPALNPLVILSCFYNPSKEVEHYKETADSVIATYDQWPDTFKDTFARDFEITLMDNGEHAAVLDYFGREPLKQFPDSIAEFDIDLATCAIITQNDTLFAHYLRQALELDSVVADNYWTQLYSGIWDQFAADPSQTELADWLIENSAQPANNALDLSIELIERYWPDTDFSWMWETLSDYTPERETSRRSILHILDKGTALDEGRSGTNVIPYISFIKAEMLMADPVMTDNAKSLLDNLTSTDQPDLRCRAIIGQAYIAAHGLDSPKEAMKILKKNIKHLEDPSVTDYARGMWYEYMAALATRLGKTKDAEKYLKLKQKNWNWNQN